MTNDSTRPVTAGLPLLIDIGINLAHDSYDSDRAEVIARAAHAGVTRLIVTGSSGPSTHAAIALAVAYPQSIFATAGVHPHHAADLDGELLSELQLLASHPQVVAVGECGLDYFRDFSPRPQQQRALHSQLELAAAVQKPAFLHVRDAHDDFVAIVREHRAALVGGIAHCFTGTRSQLEAYLQLDLAIGMTGWICDDRRGAHLHELMSAIPANRLLLETDGPYLLPRDLIPKPASRRNEPAYLPHIAATIARDRHETLEQIAASSTAAARRLFGLPGLI